MLGAGRLIVNIEFVKFLQFTQDGQGGRSRLRTVNVQLLQVLQSGKLLQPFVGDIRVNDLKALEAREFTDCF